MTQFPSSPTPNPAPIWLTVEHAAEIGQLLQRNGCMPADEHVVQVERAGQGNMNITLRVVTDRRSLIVKQARPWVERYPSIPAPVERALAEIRFYEAVQPISSVAARMPQLIQSIPQAYTLVLEDLGDASDCSTLYTDPEAPQPLHTLLGPLVQWLSDLHRQTYRQLDPEQFANRALRRLNHAHMFEIPFSDMCPVDLDKLTPGLSKIARRLRRDSRRLQRIRQLGALYIQDGDCLVHGDYYPGSWMLPDSKLRIIDPEFSFCGRPELDLAVLAAHAQIIRPSDKTLPELLELYPDPPQQLDHQLLQGWMAVEILRRLLGVAQLPVNLSLAEKSGLVERAMECLGAGQD